jgi:hypothetical protein
MADFLFTPAVLLLLRLQKYNKIGELQNSPPVFLLYLDNKNTNTAFLF